jgi:hypothetical protein
MRHFFLHGGKQVTLIVIRQSGEKWRGVDDVGVSGHRQRFGD